jgi:hypothetical protein
MFDAETTELGTMSADTWRRTLEYHADAYGGPCDIDVATVFDGSALVSVNRSGLERLGEENGGAEDERGRGDRSHDVR